MPKKPQSHAQRQRATSSVVGHHKPQYPRKRDDRPSPSKRGYGRTWQKLRKMHLNREPLCRRCMEMGHTMPASEVDHIIPKRQGGTNGKENLQSLCHSCHSTKTGGEK